MDVDAAPRNPVESRAPIDLRVEFALSGAGGTRATIRRGDDSSAVEVIVPDIALGGSRMATRDLSAPAASPNRSTPDLEGLGTRLFEAVFKADARKIYDKARADAAAPGSRVRVTLDFQSAPQLLAIPWELLYDDPLYLATQPDITILREVKTNRRSDPLLVSGMVRILGVTCSPSDMDALDTAAERERVEGELEELTRTGLADITWLEPPTVDALQQALRGGFHILHYIGHSRGPAAAEAALILEKEDGRSHQVTGSILANMIGGATTLRLAFLNSCQSATVVPGDPFSAIATKLIAVGIPAVVAMQLPVLDDAAVVFGGAFYRGLLLEEARVEEAVASGRLALLRSGYDVDWLAPVLFVDAPDTELLDLSLVGWYTLNGTEPQKRPDSKGRPSYGAGFLGLSVFDNLSRALALLGPDAEVMEYEGQTHRLWRFQDAANVAVSSRDDLITSLSVNIDADHPGDLRLWLPGGLLLGRATLADTRDAMRTLSREYGARVGNVPLEAVDIEPIEPSITRTMPENFLMESWKYVFPSPEGGIKVTFGTSTAAGRWRETPSWFSFDMDVQHRLISSCEFATRGPDERI
ncbi:CHAT domain-containing protein [Agromyces sp. NPDC004153]